MSKTICIIARDPDAALRYAEAVAHGLLHNLYPARAAAQAVLDDYPVPLKKRFHVYEFAVRRTPGTLTLTPVIDNATDESVEN